MEIHVARDGAALGVFSPDEVKAGLADGRFRPSDLAWRAGMAAWTPLAEWPEFAAAPAVAAVAASGLPGIEWETKPSPGSLLRGMVATLVSPASLVAARLEFGRSLGGAYLAILLGLPPFLGLILLNQKVEPLQTQALVAAVESFNSDFAAGLRDGIEGNSGGEQPGAAAMVCGGICGLSVLPLLAALLGLLQWPLYRLLGAKPSVGRVVSGGMLVVVWLGIALLPVSILVSLLAFASPGGSLLVGLLVQLGALILYARAMGHALGCGFWRALGVQLLLLLICCACVCCLAMLVGIAGAAAGA